MLFTSESVTIGHPDKVADQISDAILDAYLEQDPDARVAIETMLSARGVTIAGEVAADAHVDHEIIARRTIAGVGYTSLEEYDPYDIPVADHVTAQSPEIAAGVRASVEMRSGQFGVYDQQGAGDQGLMYGYATGAHITLAPPVLAEAHHITAELTRLRQAGELWWARPDGKAQVTAEVDEHGSIRRYDTVVVSAQHHPVATAEEVRADIERRILWRYMDGPQAATRVLVNPSGTFTRGGPAVDTGLTGRKIIVDTYGGWARHGGGAFSGKDPSKVDRSAAYAARWVAVNIVAARLADRAEVQLAYAIGVARPVSIRIETHGTERVPLHRIEHAVTRTFDLRPAAIIDALDLRRPIYEATARNGHIGHSFPWDRATRLDDLIRYAS